MITQNVHGLPNLPPHHRLVTKGTPWHERMLYSHSNRWNRSEARCLDEYVYCEPTYSPIPDGYELYEGEWVEGAKVDFGTGWLTRLSGADSTASFPCIRPIKTEAPLLTPYDFMKDGPWWITEEKDKSLIRMVHSVLKWSVEANNLKITYECLRQEKWQRSNNGITWQPC